MAQPRKKRMVVMGVSGCGKSTLGRALASALQLPFVEGDDLHPPSNVALMAAGTALTDDDRQGWLQAVAASLSAAEHSGVVVSCSALKRGYRDLLRAAAPDLHLVYLSGDQALLDERLRARPGHYMPASLLPSQLRTLEPPQADERAIHLSITAPTADLVAQVLNHLEHTPA
jgi:carbohydrate kinase (thermoresistant glucokinase family)